MTVQVHHRFAVVVCSDCHRPWAIELRHEKVTCARCGRTYTVADRRLVWQGDDARQAQAAIRGMTGRGEMF